MSEGRIDRLDAQIPKGEASGGYTPVPEFRTEGKTRTGLSLDQPNRIMAFAPSDGNYDPSNYSDGSSGAWGAVVGPWFRTFNSTAARWTFRTTLGISVSLVLFGGPVGALASFPVFVVGGLIALGLEGVKSIRD